MSKLTCFEVARLLLEGKHNKATLLLILKTLDTADIEIEASVAIHESPISAQAQTVLDLEKVLKAAKTEYDRSYHALLRRLVPHQVRESGEMRIGQPEIAQWQEALPDEADSDMSVDSDDSSSAA